MSDSYGGKDAWETPALEVLGDLETLTSTGGTTVPDGASTLATLSPSDERIKRLIEPVDEPLRLLRALILKENG